MIGWIIKLNNTGKCIVINKPNSTLFHNLKFNFERGSDVFISFLRSLSQNDSKIIPRNNNKCNRIPWLVWTHNNFQYFYKQNEDKFQHKDRVVVVKYIYFPPESEYWTLILQFYNRSTRRYESRHILSGKITVANTLLKFGSKNEKVIHKIKEYDSAMLRYVHRLRDKLKYEMDPKIRRDLRIKYNKLKKRIN